METSLRNTLRLAITSCRRLLEEDHLLQLEGRYGIRADGSMEPLDALKNLDAKGLAERRSIEAALQHEILQEKKLSQAITRFVRESAFTALNRFAALKLMENPTRGLIVESVGKKEQSKGFRQFLMISPEALRDKPDGGYELYLELLIDDLAQTLGALFDRSLPQSILFPSQTCLSQILDLLNQPELDKVWGEDETIGWIYQYFTPPELRDQVRKESPAPRNGNELAFRNQFYTPRYVVEFLTDNTLGRLWVDINGGQTKLKDQCQYLIWPEHAEVENETEPSLKDPRQLRILDPACGSGHFLLYSFDLLETIYQEAYENTVLRQDFTNQDEFKRAIPSLILANNLHGIDIDLRAVQIASLALWLRAQRSFTNLNIPPRKRRIKLNPQIVCAEPMPGEYELLGEYLRDLKPAILGNLVREVWERMQGADEIGGLLKIEHEIRAAITKARTIWQSTPEGVQLTLFGESSDAVQLKMDLSEIKDETFWERAEQEALNELELYARASLETNRVTRQLFSHDAIQGFAFVNLLLRPFDVVLMNPPFGSPSLGSKEYITKNYSRTKNDLYAAFVERGLDLLAPGGYLGAITSRTGFFLKSFQSWREEILLKEAQVIALADLGYGVLDTAMVETAAYILQKRLE
jgi:Eco57I restriction-modification methylase